MKFATPSAVPGVTLAAVDSYIAAKRATLVPLLSTTGPFCSAPLSRYSPDADCRRMPTFVAEPTVAISFGCVAFDVPVNVKYAFFATLVSQSTSLMSKFCGVDLSPAALNVFAGTKPRRTVWSTEPASMPHAPATISPVKLRVPVPAANADVDNAAQATADRRAFFMAGSVT
ncbi:hypothetical protein DO71_6050 [Burkholderia pseudomallei]|nr:hypothetical protein DO62_5853 [Burkholderia pseudomallei]KGS61141.1 hypothetical protein X990_5537 [Burkholderia pseudomallei MSHR4868]KGW44188.1 hypothetical protein Y597_6194 [Burkholderia pseudomallei MSHR1000]KGX48202.1 hypothetical protein Y600_5956 [Burkholderia pseudomallei MSHR3709]KGC47920.1 hypothetical protein DO65_6227 [Burkholderia pseudomallei]